MTGNWVKLARRYKMILVAVVALMMVVVLAGGFWLWNYRQPGLAEGQKIPPGIRSQDNGGIVKAEEKTPVFSFSLSEGQQQPQGEEVVPQSTGEPLSDEQTAALLSRLPVLTPLPQTEQEFRLAQQPIPPPTSAEIIAEDFPPAEQSTTPEPVEPGPLQVLRYSPEGEIDLAPFISVTFNQPMVALGTLNELAAQQVPVSVEPEIPGTWRWLGARTLTFQAESDLVDRLPKATTFRLKIPAGTKSATGGTLAQDVTWSFTTPAPKITFNYPAGMTQPRDPLFFIAFDQRIDPAAVLKTITVSASNKSYALKLITEETLAADANRKWLLSQTQAGRWLAFRAEELFPADTDVEVSVGPGTPSAEGPLVTQEAAQFSFHTYAPLKIMQHGCAWGGSTCQPLTPFSIQFNNPIDDTVYRDDMLRIEPELPGAEVDVMGSTIQIRGISKGQTTYTVTVSGEIQDIYGQTLGQETRLQFRVGKADAVLYNLDRSFITLDPSLSKPSLSVYAVNYPRLDVTIYQVEPANWPEFKGYLRKRGDMANTTPPGKQVFSKSIPVEAPADSLAEVKIDLSQVMKGKYGQFIVVVAPPANLQQDPSQRYWQTINAWVQVTQIGLDAYFDNGEMLLWASALKDGAPLNGVKLTAYPGQQEAATGENGTARMPVPQGSTYLVAQQGDDLAILPRSDSVWSDEAWQSWPQVDELRWYIFDDRQMYRPGEEVHVKGWLRRVGAGPKGDVSLVGGQVDSISYEVTGSQGENLGGGEADVNTLGGFDFVIKLPEGVNLGFANISLKAQGSFSNLGNLNAAHSFYIQEFRRPEFEVTASSQTPGPYFAGGSADVAVDAQYYAGGGLANAPVTWAVRAAPSSYSPPKWPGFVFGTWIPWWEYGSGHYNADPFNSAQTFEGKTDASGAHYLHLDFPANGFPQPVTLTAEASVMDVNYQAWVSGTNLLVHPAAAYIGLRSERYFVPQGTPIQLGWIVTDLDGSPIIDRPVEIRAARIEWKYRAGRWQREETDEQVCKGGSLDTPGSCSFDTPQGGVYEITALVTDSQGRVNQTRLTRWVSGGKLPPVRQLEQEMVTLIPDKEIYQPGDVAQILVQSPFPTAKGMLILARSGFVSSLRFQVVDGSAVLDIPIEESFIPNLHVQVDLNGSAERAGSDGSPVRGAPARPAFATGSLNLSIPPYQRKLDLQVQPLAAELQPGEGTTIAVSVKDAAGNPVGGAEVAVVAVDEAILALSNYKITDPLDLFYMQRSMDFTSLYGRASILLADPAALEVSEAMEKSLDQGAGAMPAPSATMAPAAPQSARNAESESKPIAVRSNFNPLAVFAPAVRTAADGTAEVAVQLPDNLTRYRIMAVAVDELHKFGAGEANLTARLPLMVRPSAPRFLNFGDEFDLAVVLQNQTGSVLEAVVAVQGENLELDGPAGLRIAIPAHDRVKVTFPARTKSPGTARIQLAASAGDFADAVVLELPVYTPATTEAFATYGVIDSGAVSQPVTSPAGVFPQFGGLEISTSSTALQSLTDAVLYLIAYPYECSEQLASRILAVAALKDVLAAFNSAELPSPEAIQAAMERDIEKLSNMQNSDGGYPYWQRGGESIPYNTIHVAHALTIAADKGYTVSEGTRQSLLAYLTSIEDYYPQWYSQDTRRTLSAYALFVRGRMGDRDSQKALALYQQAGADGLSLDALGWLWPVLQDSPGTQTALAEIRQYVNNRVVETAGAANFTTDYDDQNYLLLGSNRRTDAILLDALILDNPGSDLIPKLVKGLLAHRQRGRWMNTQENVFVLLALDHYFAAYESQPPDFVARVWLGDAYAGEQAFKGYTAEQHVTSVPMSYLVDPAQAASGPQTLVLDKEGTGRLYYRLGLKYAPTDLKMNPLDMGFVVTRKYEAVDDAGDVSQDANGAWHIKVGTRVRVRVNMVADNRRYHVALVSPLPAGLEILNPTLATTGTVPQDPSSSQFRYGWWWWGPWYNHQNLRDERAEAFTPLLWDGVYEYTFVARATNTGQFIVPPAKAEEMYSPEVFGRSSSEVVIVE